MAGTAGEPDRQPLGIERQVHFEQFLHPGLVQPGVVCQRLPHQQPAQVLQQAGFAPFRGLLFLLERDGHVVLDALAEPGCPARRIVERSEMGETGPPWLQGEHPVDGLLPGHRVEGHGRGGGDEQGFAIVIELRVMQAEDVAGEEVAALRIEEAAVVVGVAGGFDEMQFLAAQLKAIALVQCPAAFRRRRFEPAEEFTESRFAIDGHGALLQSFGIDQVRQSLVVRGEGGLGAVGEQSAGTAGVVEVHVGGQDVTHLPGGEAEPCQDIQQPGHAVARAAVDEGQLITVTDEVTAGMAGAVQPGVDEPGMVVELTEVMRLLHVYCVSRRLGLECPRCRISDLEERKMTPMKRLTLTVALASALGSSTVPALEFSRTWFFGTSYLDSGAFVGNPDTVEGGKFTTNPGPVLSELLARKLGTSAVANNPDNPRTDPEGTNYAQGGAQVTNPLGYGQSPSPQHALPVRDQVDHYFESTARADRNALYVVAGGGNDIFYEMDRVAAGEISLDEALAYLGTSAADLAGQVQRLSDAGARYVMVPLVLDMEVFPAWVLETVAHAGEGNPAQGEALVAAMTVLARGGTDAAQVRLDALAAGEAALGLPPGSLLPTFRTVSGLGSGLSNFFSDTLLTQIGAVRGNVILIDLRSLFNEMVADPGSFGLVNVTGTACTTPSSLRCTPDTLVDPRAPGLFLFADGAHPTTAGHRILADYAFSVIAAPALVANLPEVALGSIRGHQDLLLSHVRGGFGEGWSLFAAGGMGTQDLEAGQAWDADSDDSRLMAGVARRLNLGWVIGGALEASRSDVDFGDDKGGFELNAVEFSLFADYQRERLFGTLLGTLSFNADFDDVERLVKLGGGVRREKGDTSGDLWAIKGVLGYRLWQRDGFSLGPFGSLNYQSAQVDGYREAGRRSTSMNFGSQDRDSFLLEVGLFADYSFSRTHLHGGVSYEAELEDDSRKLSAGLNSLPGSRFYLYDIAPSDYYWKLDLSLNSQVADGVGLGIGYQLRNGEDGNGDQQVNVGITVTF